EEEIRQRHTQHGGDALEGMQGRHGLAVLELTDKTRGDSGTLGEFNGRQSPRLAHTSKLFPQIHEPSLTLRGEPGEPGSLGKDNSGRLEARPEAEFSLQGGGLAGTILEARLLQVTVGQLRQLVEALPHNRGVPREADIKVGIEGPLPVATQFVV